MTSITLSFDNGPDPEVTPQVLGILRKHGIKSSFFVLGDKLRDRRQLCEMAHDDGHWIGNHTYNHLVPLGATGEAGMAIEEIERTQQLIGELAHQRRFFRPFGGGGILNDRLLSDEAVDYLQKNEFTCVLWNAVPHDWIFPSSWVDRAINMCRQQEHALLVLHDISTGAMDHLDLFIERAKDIGGVFEQEFPRDCVVMDSGKIVGDIHHYTSRELAAPEWKAASVMDDPK